MKDSNTPVRLLLVSATPFEIAPIIEYLGQNYQEEEGSYWHGLLEIRVLITGVGLVSTTYHLTDALHSFEPNLTIQLGIAGAIDQSLEIGQVYQVQSESFGDLGVEEQDGSFTDVFDLGLTEANQFPFQQKRMENPATEDFPFLPAVKGLSVHQVTGSQASVDALRHRTEAQIESMEGAAFFYTCLQKGIPFLEIRSISNYVEPRNRANWKLAEAITALNQAGLSLIQEFEQMVPKPSRPPGFYPRSLE